MKILRTASLGSNFTGSYRKREYINTRDVFRTHWSDDDY